MTDRELMQQALEALNHVNVQDRVQIITALRERLAQPEQEPVATVTSESGNPNLSMSWWHEPALLVGTKIYTSPQPNKQWVGLTANEIWKCNKSGSGEYHICYAHQNLEDFAEAIEAKLKEKNQ